LAEPVEAHCGGIRSRRLDDQNLCEATARNYAINLNLRHAKRLILPHSDQLSEIGLLSKTHNDVVETAYHASIRGPGNRGLC
jgi:hypothetical protein